MTEQAPVELLRQESRTFDTSLPAVRMDKDMLMAIDDIAEQQSVKRSVVVRAALRFFLQSNVSQTNINTQEPNNADR